jgi:ParB-like chromosome segregation protein Spo0J
MKLVKISKIKVNPILEDLFKKYPLTEIELKSIENSIETDGFKEENPIVLNENYEIVKGHHRVKSAKNLGFAEVPCVIKKYDTDEDMKIDAIEDNINRRNINEYSQIELRSELGILQKMRDEAKESKKRKSVGVNLPRQKYGRVREKIAEQIGVSDKTVQKALKVIEKADEDTKVKLRKGEKSIHGAFEYVDKIADNLSDEAKELIKDTDLEDDNSELLQLAKLKDKPKRQRRVVKKILNKEADDVKTAIKEVLREAIQKKADKITLADDDYKVIHGDFRKVDIKPNSIDAIVTDPPYPEEYLPLWKDLGKFADKVLKPKGFLIAYSGHIHLPAVFSSLEKSGLKYYWTFALLHGGHSQMVNGRNLIAEWKPVLVYQKEPFKKISTNNGVNVGDVIKDTHREKSLHDWQQNVEGVKHLVKLFTKSGNTIIDPFAGSGTTLVACKKTKRRCIGIDIDKKCIDTIKVRLQSNEIRRNE